MESDISGLLGLTKFKISQGFWLLISLFSDKISAISYRFLFFRFKKLPERPAKGLNSFLAKQKPE